MNFHDRAARSIVKAKPGFHFGLLAGVKVKGILYLNTGVIYTDKGFDSDDEKLKIGYVEVPFLLSLNWPARLSPRLFVGPVVSFETKCNSSRVPGFDELSCDHPLASVQRQKTDIGLALGGGVGLPLGAGSAFFDLWLNQGLRDISLEPRPSGWVRNQALILSAGYRYPLGGSL